MNTAASHYSCYGNCWYNGFVLHADADLDVKMEACEKQQLGRGHMTASMNAANAISFL